MAGQIKVLLRDRFGKEIITPAEPIFVEIRDKDGQIAFVVCHTETGTIKILEQGTHDAERYARMFNVQFAPIVDRRPS